METSEVFSDKPLAVRGEQNRLCAASLRLERQALESLTTLNSTEATESSAYLSVFSA